MVGIGSPASCGGWNRSPGSFSTSSSESPLCFGASGFVRTMVVSTWARFAKVHQAFSPVTRYLPPDRTARVFTAAASEPTSGSVNAAAASTSPEQSFGSHFFFCASVPFAWMSVPVMIIRVITEPTESHARDSSSVTRAIERQSRPEPPYSAGKIRPK